MWPIHGKMPIPLRRTSCGGSAGGIRQMTDTRGIADAKGWPPRPAGEVVPDLLDTLLVGQLLLYDRRGMTPDQACRNVRKLVKESGLPTLGRIGSTLLYDKAAVIAWVGSRSGVADGDQDSNLESA